MALLVVVGIALGVARTALADDDDDDDTHESPGQSSIESWPPTEVGWPPLAAPDSDGDDSMPVVVPTP